jgi:hypothetical protein
MELTEGQKLAQELAQAIVSNDETALNVAVSNIVGNALDSLASIADALQRLAEHADYIVPRNFG